MWYLLFCAVVLFAPNVYCQDADATITVDNNGFYFNNSINCVPKKIQTHPVIVNKTGIGLAVFLNETHLNPDNGEYIVISREPDNSAENSSVVYITGDQKNIDLAIPLVNEAFISFYPGEECEKSTNFTILLKPYEEAPPDLPNTTPNPNPPSGIRTDIRIYLAGKTISEFQNPEFLSNFQSTVQKAAFDFSKANSYQYDEDKLANETVFLKSTATCSSKWPDYERCVTALMSVFVTKSRVDYELTVTHLERFWDEMEINGLPDDLGVQHYDFPDVSDEIGWRILWILVAVGVTILVAVLLWKMERKSNDQEDLKKKRDMERFQEMFPTVTLRNDKNYSLRLSKHQKIPEYMLGNADSMSVGSNPIFSTEKKFKSKMASGSSAPNFSKPIFPSKHFADLAEDVEEIQLQRLDK